MRSSLAVCVLLVALGAPSCATTDDEVRPNVDEVERDVERHESLERRAATVQAYEDRASKALRDADAAMSRLQLHASAAGGSTRRDFEEKMRDLAVRQQALRVDVRRLDDEGDRIWPALEPQLRRELVELEASIDDANRR